MLTDVQTPFLGTPLVPLRMLESPRPSEDFLEQAWPNPSDSPRHPAKTRLGTGYTGYFAQRVPSL